MKNLNTILERIESAKERYDTLKLSFISDQMEILRDLSVSYSDLTEHRIEATEVHRGYYFKSEEKSHAAKEREADLKCPELYLIKRNMDDCIILIKAVTSTLSSAKQLKNG